MMNSPTLLLADDHLPFLEALHQMLSRTLRVVGLCDNGEDLVEKAITLRPDIILSDISMPRMTGFEALRNLKIRWPEVKVIFLTSHANPAYRTEAVRAGACGYVTKLVDQHDLMQAIHVVHCGGTHFPTTASLPRDAPNSA